MRLADANNRTETVTMNNFKSINKANADGMSIEFFEETLKEQENGLEKKIP